MLVYQRVPAPLCQEALETPSANATARAPLVGTSRNSSAVPVPIRRPELSHNPGVIQHAGRGKREDKNNKHNKTSVPLQSRFLEDLWTKWIIHPKNKHQILSYPIQCGSSFPENVSVAAATDANYQPKYVCHLDPYSSTPRDKTHQHPSTVVYV